MEQICSKCGELHSRQNQRYCKKCHAQYMREHRPKHSELSPEQRQKSNARSYANGEQRRGKLTPEPCKICGSMEVQKHHPDYRQPLVVEWVCRPCHMAEHERLNRVEQFL